MIKCRAILKNGTVVIGYVEETFVPGSAFSMENDVGFLIGTVNPAPNQIVRVQLGNCKKITLTNVKDGNANDQDNEGGE